MLGQMPVRLRSAWLDLLHTLWFVPSAIAVAYVALSEGLVQLDAAVHFHSAWVFGGSGHAARTVLQVIAGSLITVAGLTFSVTMVVLQLTSSQFSPRIVRNYLGDRIAQLTIGSFVGIFAYCLVALRSIGDVSHGAPVPRLTLTVASALALLALAMLIAFIHHITQLVQASELTARLAAQTLESIERLYPAGFGEDARSEDADELLERWRAEGPPGIVHGEKPGYVQAVELDALAHGLPTPRPRVRILVAPGDFAFGDEPLAEVWPAERADDVHALVCRCVTIRSERDISQDVNFGVRQLADIALRAISPSVNDPTTAITCIGYLRSILNRLAARDLPSPVRRDRDDEEPLLVRRREFAEHLEAFAEIGRYAAGDARVVRALLSALGAVGGAAAAAGASDRALDAAEIARGAGEQALAGAGSARDRELVAAALRQSLDSIIAPPRAARA
jgi:uncharacterized membrane protein